MCAAIFNVDMVLLVVTVCLWVVTVVSSSAAVVVS